MMSLADTTIHKVRKIATDLRPGILDDIGLAAAIEWQGKDFSERTGIQFAFNLDEELQMDEKRSTAFFRILQEFLSNSVKYSEAKNINIILNYQMNNLVITAKDDGKGFDFNKAEMGSGLINMKSRATLIDANLELISRPSEGVKLEIIYPIL